MRRTPWNPRGEICHNNVPPDIPETVTLKMEKGKRAPMKRSNSTMAGDAFKELFCCSAEGQTVNTDVRPGELYKEDEVANLDDCDDFDEVDPTEAPDWSTYFDMSRLSSSLGITPTKEEPPKADPPVRG